MEHFADLEDPRTRESSLRLEEMLLVAIGGILSGADRLGRGGVVVGEAKLP